MTSPSFPTTNERSNGAPPEMTHSTSSDRTLQLYQQAGVRAETDTVISPESSISCVGQRSHTPLPMILSLKALPPITPRQNRWCFTASCTSAAIFLVAAIAVIFFTTQKPLGFVFLGMAVLSVLVGCYSRRLNSERHSKRPTQSSNSGIPRAQSALKEPRCVQLELGLDKEALASQSWNQRNLSISPHPVPQTSRNGNHIVPSNPSSGVQATSIPLLKGTEDSVSLDILNKPTPPVPAKKPLAKSAMTQSSASVRPRFVGPTIGYDSVPRVYRPNVTNHHTSPSQGTMSEKDYAMIEAAIQDAYSTVHHERGAWTDYNDKEFERTSLGMSEYY